MSKKLEPMASSAKPIINTRRIRKDGKARIYLRVIIDRDVKDINLDCQNLTSQRMTST
jgi:hypothetical protein